MRFFSTYYFKIFLSLLIIALFLQNILVLHDKDFDIFIGASKLIFEGKNCYEVWLISGTSGLKYFYSPLFAILLFPLKEAPQLVYNIFWMALNFVIVYRLFSLLSYFLPIKKLLPSKQAIFFALSIACVARYVLDNLSLGQMTILLLWGTMESMRLINEKKYVTGSALLALIINFKLLPLTLLVYLIYKKEFKAVGYVVLFSVVYLYLPALVIGYNFNQQLLHNWYASLTATSDSSVVEDIARPGFSSWIPSLLMELKDPLSPKQNFVNLSVEKVKLILNIVSAFFLVIVAFLLGKPSSKLHSKKKLFYDLSVICLVTPLIFPHQGKYALLYLLPAYSFIIYKIIRLSAIKNSVRLIRAKRILIILLSLSFLLVTLTTDGLIGRQLADFAEYRHLITYGVFFLFAALIFARPTTGAHKLS